MRILVIAPHPDDEVLGCGGTILKHSKKGDEVFLCVVTKTYTPDWSEEDTKVRKKEVEASNKILGIKKTYFLDYPTVKLDTVPQKELNDAISKIVKNVKPDIALIPFIGDLNRDHRIVSESSLVALRPSVNFSVKKIWSYETISETEWALPVKKNMFRPNVYIDISDTLKTKLKAMLAYKSELRDHHHPRSLETLSVLAEKRGSEVCLKFAEAFMSVRDIVK